MKIQLLQRGLSISDIYWRILSNPQLWNEHKERTQDQQSPHYGLDDIWARFGEKERAVDGKEHESVWYPSADILGVKDFCLSLADHLQAKALGGVLITRIPPGKECKPHEDHGWHARIYEKFALQIASAPGQVFCFDDVELETRPGDLFTFDNQYMHWVKNPTNYERITMIICIKR